MTTSGKAAMRVVLLGTYDLGKPRTRLLRESLRQIDPALRMLHFPVWEGVEDKSVMRGPGARLEVGLRLLLAYPVLALRYLFAGPHDVVVIGYMGLFDMLLLAPLAKLRGKPVVWDAFLSIYDTYARDRAMGAEQGLKARALRWMERQACRIADKVVLDTKAHAALMGDLHQVPAGKLDAVLVGAEREAFAVPAAVGAPSPDAPIKVLFYGQFIPLHGIDTIIDAALQPRGAAYHWTIIGQGQEAGRIDARLAEADAPHVERINWVDYTRLGGEMDKADICLGIFGTSDKASRVIPNKVYQAFAVGKPLITRDSNAMRELVEDADEGIYLIPPNDPDALLDALDKFAGERAALPPVLHGRLQDRFSFPALAGDWQRILATVAETE
ncbi:glycosyltransferase [Aurantiacibacter sp. MUD11]|uniref:glycosyltransferase n=1 Tax=Aurantiacibacter sp. MUD11 TaxID=3003265 RepID=UPI0022AA8922|nr:glycosyltransferase [Aurantiacibacter sp. MUD11]WAT18764.1 glycosyltransferase [Aurantiacibacter sp. MUD11]